MTISTGDDLINDALFVKMNQTASSFEVKIWTGAKQWQELLKNWWVLLTKSMFYSWIITDPH